MAKQSLYLGILQALLYHPLCGVHHLTLLNFVEQD